MKNYEIQAEIICVGSEILLGHIINTNASYLSRKLAAEGINLYRQSVVGDNPARLSEAIHNALRRSDIVITSGGLGPTVDDITIKAIADSLSLPLVLNKNVLRSIEIHFKKRHIKMPAQNRLQAYVPQGAMAVINPVGTAPASIIERGGKTVIALPGPPRELIPIFENSVLPYIRKRYGVHSVIFTRTIRTTGAPESTVNEKVERFLQMKGDVTVGIYASLGEVNLKITAKAQNEKEALRKIKKIESKIAAILGNIVYGLDNDSLESVIGRLFTKKYLTLSIAESCTGGFIANRITNISGSSKYFLEGIITYSNQSKVKGLGVPAELIKKYGAVSRPVAIAMAKGMIKRSGSDYALAVTGIAGPTGGTKKKPVGVVYIALAKKKGTGYFFNKESRYKKSSLSPFSRSIERRFLGSRLDIKLQTSTVALDLLRKTLTAVEVVTKSDRLQI